MIYDDAIAEVARFFRVLLEKFFPSADEREKNRTQIAKENWDKLIEEEKRIEADLYKPHDLK